MYRKVLHIFFLTKASGKILYLRRECYTVIRLCLKIHTIDITFNRGIVSQVVTELHPFNNTVSMATYTTERGQKKKKNREGKKNQSL